MNTTATAATANRLASCTSPYLLQHAYNPVDWWPWRAEAFQQARRQDKPVFLSIGYASCHWCHVMEHESFARPDVAAIMNENFICIKVDREERPDLDDIYMTATQLFTGQGGWPNSVFLTPDAEPWYAGTYWPADDRPGIIGFKSLLAELARLWRTRRQDVLEQARQITLALKQTVLAEGPRTTAQLERKLIEQALRALHETFDTRHGGFGAAPKFPPHGTLALTAYELGRDKNQMWQDMLLRTLQAMSLGGIHDHVGGGFHRYATDERWLLPHFEKMLYDNAQLLSSYAQAWQLSGNDEFRQAAFGIVDWLAREMADPQGGFYSSLDADSEGVEGKYYLWQQPEIVDVLGNQEGELFCRVFNVLPEGNFPEQASAETAGGNVLYLGRTIAVNAKVEGMDEDVLRKRLSAGLTRLREHRELRVRPGLDDKILASWNGLAMAGLARAGRIFQDSRCVELAERAADFVLTRMFRDGRLVASYRGGPGPTQGYLDDYAFMALGLIELHEARPQARRLEQAQALMAVLEKEFADEQRGGYFFTAKDHEDLLVRMKNPFDSAIPSGNAVAAQVQARLAMLTGRPEHWRQARRTLEAFGGILQQAPHGAVNMTLSLAIFLDNVPAELAPAGQAATGQPVLAESGAGPVTVRLRWGARPSGAAPGAPGSAVRPGQTLHLSIDVVIEEGWHINSAQPFQDFLAPTKVELAAGPGRLQGVTYPPGQSVQLPFNDVPLSAYQGQVKIDVELAVNADAPAGPAKFALLLSAQPCDNMSCQPPRQHRLEFELEIAGLERSLA